MNRSPKPDYGIDSLAIVLGQAIAGLLATALAIFKPRAFDVQVRWIEGAAALYFLHGAWTMLRYSRSGKLGLARNCWTWFRGEATRRCWTWVADKACSLSGRLAGSKPERQSV